VEQWKFRQTDGYAKGREGYKCQKQVSKPLIAYGIWGPKNERQSVSGTHILPHALLSSARAWDALWHDRTTRPSRFSLSGIKGFRIFAVLDFLDAHFTIYELVYVGYHHWALYIHESEGRRGITEIGQ
jgi:hypothetical protein